MITHSRNTDAPTVPTTNPPTSHFVAPCTQRPARVTVCPAFATREFHQSLKRTTGLAAVAPALAPAL